MFDFAVEVIDLKAKKFLEFLEWKIKQNKIELFSFLIKFALLENK